MGRKEIANGAKKVVEVCAGVKPGERVLILTDNQRPLSVAEALAAAAGEIGAEVKLMTVAPGDLPGEEPHESVAAAMAGADVILSPTTRTMAHSKAMKRALELGARALTMTECTEQVLTSGAIEADFFSLQPMVDYVEKRFNSAESVHVTAPGGTDLRLDISRRQAATCPGLCHKPGKFIGIPDVEVYIAPVEEKTEGILVIDASASGIGLIERPITIVVEKGRVQSIEGGGEAEKMKYILNAANDPAARVIAEFAVGLNPKGTVIGNIITDEGVYGTGHFAVGNNTSFGGKNAAPIHLDLVYWKPTIEFDGNLFMKDGALVRTDSV